MQQRLRVAADTVQKDLIMAGAGMYSGQMVGTLDAYFSPLLPHKVGTVSPDPAGTFHANPNCPTTCADAVTIMYVPTTTAQTTHPQDMPTPSSELKVEPAARVPDVRQRPAVRVQGGHARPDHEPRRRLRHLHDHQRAGRRPVTSSIGTTSSRRTSRPDRGSRRVVSAHVLPPGRRRQRAAAPVTTTATTPTFRSRTTSSDFRVEFFGDPSPPAGHQALHGGGDRRRPLDDVRSAAAGADRDQRRSAVRGWRELPLQGGCGLRPCRCRARKCRRSARPAAAPVLMPASMLTDGPWCPADVNSAGDALPSKYNADMLRVRKVRLTLPRAGGGCRAPRAGRNALPSRRHVEQRRAARAGSGDPVRRRAAQPESRTLRTP